MLVLHIVNSVVIIDFSLADMSIVPRGSVPKIKTANYPHFQVSQNTVKTKDIKKNWIGYVLVISFECQQENVDIPFCSLLRIWYKSLEKSVEVQVSMFNRPVV